VGKYDEYRMAALDCVALADASRDPHSRTVLLKMAEMWTHLADQAAKNSRTDITYETPPPRRFESDHPAH
jgi:hypothetical protein